MSLGSRRRWRGAAALVATVFVLAGCAGGSSDVVGGANSDADTTLRLVAYAVPEPGWSKIIPAFAATPGGKGVEVTTSYGASGDQSRSVVDGKPADIVNFSVEPDVTRLVKAGKVRAIGCSNLDAEQLKASLAAAKTTISSGLIWLLAVAASKPFMLGVSTE